MMAVPFQLQRQLDRLRRARGQFGGLAHRCLVQAVVARGRQLQLDGLLDGRRVPQLGGIARLRRRGPDVSNLVGLEIDLDRGSFQRDGEHVDAAGKAGRVTAVINWIGKAAVDANFLGQLELQVFLVTEGGRPVGLERNRDQVQITLGAVGQLGGQRLDLGRRSKERHPAAEVDRMAGVRAIELGGDNGRGVRFPRESRQQMEFAIVPVANAELDAGRVGAHGAAPARGVASHGVEDPFEQTAAEPGRVEIDMVAPFRVRRRQRELHAGNFDGRRQTFPLQRLPLKLPGIDITGERDGLETRFFRRQLAKTQRSQPHVVEKAQTEMACGVERRARPSRSSRSSR